MYDVMVINGWRTGVLTGAIEVTVTQINPANPISE